MSENLSFNKRAAETVSYYAHLYKSTFMDYQYLVCSSAFINKPYYIISSNADNYMHLTGIMYYSPQVFFNKCILGTLNENDIVFEKNGQSEKSIKGSVRRKIKVLPDLMNIFKSSLLAEESFSKNRIVCSFGTSDGIYTIGFTSSSKDNLVKPMTLLSGFELDKTKARNVDLVLRRETGKDLFDSMIVGDKDILSQYKNSFSCLLSDKLK